MIMTTLVESRKIYGNKIYGQISLPFYGSLLGNALSNRTNFLKKDLRDPTYVSYVGRLMEILNTY